MYTFCLDKYQLWKSAIHETSQVEKFHLVDIILCDTKLRRIEFTFFAMDGEKVGNAAQISLSNSLHMFVWGFF
jgi:hypothetical protein